MNILYESLVNKSTSAQADLRDIIIDDIKMFACKEYDVVDVWFVDNTISIIITYAECISTNIFLYDAIMYKHVKSCMGAFLLDFISAGIHYTESITDTKSTNVDMRDRSVYMLTLL